MREYIILVAVSAILAAFSDILAPKEWRGYIRVVTGFLILAVLLTPVAKFKNIEIFDVEEKFKVSEMPVRDEVSRQLKLNVERDIEERISLEFKERATASVDLDIDEEHKIRGVMRIVIKCKKIPSGLKERLNEVYGCENIEFRPE